MSAEDAKPSIPPASICLKNVLEVAKKTLESVVPNVVKQNKQFLGWGPKLGPKFKWAPNSSRHKRGAVLYDTVFYNTTQHGVPDGGTPSNAGRVHEEQSLKVVYDGWSTS